MEQQQNIYCVTFIVSRMQFISEDKILLGYHTKGAITCGTYR